MRRLAELGRSAAPFAAILATGCRAPTQVTVEVTTDLPCGSEPETRIAVGTLGADLEDKPPVVDSSTCDPSGRLGALVLVPSGERDEAFAVKVVTTFARGERPAPSPESCATRGPDGRLPDGCIVQRRALRFLPHTALSLPVAMREVCDGVYCPEAETCTPAGTCAAATIDATSCDEGCADQALWPSEPGDAGAEDGALPPPPDGAPGVDAGGDAAVETGPAHPCTDTSFDPYNCGACGYECLGGPCEGGACTRLLLAPANFPQSIVVGSGYVYWSDFNGVHGVPVGGGTRIDVNVGISPSTAIALDSQYVYCASHDPFAPGIYRTPIGGGPVILLDAGEGADSAVALAVAGTDLFWADSIKVVRVSLVDGGVSPVAEEQDIPSALAVDGTHVYWANRAAMAGAGAIWRAPLHGGAPTRLVSGLESLLGIAVGGGRVIWAGTTVSSAPVAGGAITQLSSDVAGSVAADATRAYWAAGGVLSAPVHGGPTTRIVDGALSGSVAVDATHVYWGDESPVGWGIYRIRKP